MPEVIVQPANRAFDTKIEKKKFQPFDFIVADDPVVDETERRLGPARRIEPPGLAAVQRDTKDKARKTPGLEAPAIPLRPRRLRIEARLRLSIVIAFLFIFSCTPNFHPKSVL